MPKVKPLGVPIEQQRLEAELRERYGGMMFKHNVQQELGNAHSLITAEFLEGIPYVQVGKGKRYRVSDVARRIYERTVRPEEEKRYF